MIVRGHSVTAPVTRQTRTFMKSPTIKKTLGVTIVVLAVITLGFWNQICEAFGPMDQRELQCLICHRERVKKWVCRSKVRDDIITNPYSEWVDSFTPSDHEHVWVGTTSYRRSHWFGRTSIACVGIAIIPRMFEHRSLFGESRAQQLASKFHELVRGQSSAIDFDQLYRFENTLVENPASLLDADNPD